MGKLRESGLWALLTEILITDRRNTIKKVAFLALLILVFGKFDYPPQAYAPNSTMPRVPTSVTSNTTVPLTEVHQDSTVTFLSAASTSSPLTDILLPNAFSTLNLDPFTMAYSSNYGDQGGRELVHVQFGYIQYVQHQNTSGGSARHAEGLRMTGEQSYLTEAYHLLGNSTSTLSGGVSEPTQSGGIPTSIQSGSIGPSGAEITENRTSVPEPSTIILLSAGLTGLGIMRKRLRK